MSAQEPNQERQEGTPRFDASPEIGMYEAIRNSEEGRGMTPAEIMHTIFALRVREN